MKHHIGDALCELIPFVQFLKSEKHPWRSVTFSKVASKVGFTYNFNKSNAPPWHGCFSRFLNCTNGTKSHKTSHMMLFFLK